METNSFALLVNWDNTNEYGTLYDVPAQPYDATYWERYLQLDRTVTGQVLTQARIDLVKRYYAGHVVDVGIGGGNFVTMHGDCSGIDVNPSAIQWLKQCECLHDADTPIEAATFWDSAEHMNEADLLQLIGRVHQWCFISMPIYSGKDDALKSKHFKPGEHLMYFTHNGLIKFMQAAGWSLVEWNDMETQLGREAINSYAFMRVRW